LEWFVNPIERKLERKIQEPLHGCTPLAKGPERIFVSAIAIRCALVAINPYIGIPQLIGFIINRVVACRFGLRLGLDEATEQHLQGVEVEVEVEGKRKTKSRKGARASTSPSGQLWRLCAEIASSAKARSSG
jgi:hypothetical protein